MRYRYRGDVDEWVCVSGIGGDVDLTIESARRLLGALQMVLAGSSESTVGRRISLQTAESRESCDEQGGEVGGK